MVNRSRKLKKDRQYNGQAIKDKQLSTKYYTPKTEHCAIRIPTKILGAVKSGVPEEFAVPAPLLQHVFYVQRVRHSLNTRY